MEYLCAECYEIQIVSYKTIIKVCFETLLIYFKTLGHDGLNNV